MEINISQHAMTRYAERIKLKEDALNVNTYIAKNEEQIKEDISKMVEFGKLIYSGRQKPPNDKNIADVYLNGLWIVLVDQKKNNVITLYKVDLNLGDDFNKEYVSRLVEKIERQKEIVEERKVTQQKERDRYYQHIHENEETIKEMRKTIKELEALNESYNTILNNMLSENSAQEKELADLVNTLIAKTEF